MLTVLMTTYKGAKTLRDVLEAFCQLEEPPGGWKMVIVDNGSTDRTQEIIRSYCQRLPITILYEPRRGQNVARNSGLKSVDGDLIVLTDDDVLPQPDWLVQMRAAADLNPSFSIFGGAVLPKWEIPPNEWILNLKWLYLGVTFGIVNTEFEEGPIEPDYVVSPNMAIRADIFKAGHGFDVTIGPDGSKNYPMGSEGEFTKRMARAGYKSWHCKSAVVHHIIRSYQMEKGWALGKAIRFGRGWYRIWAKHSLNSPAFQRIPRYLIRQAIIQTQISIQTIRVASAEWSGHADRIFREHWWLNYYVGKAIESRSMGIKRQSLQTIPPR